MNFSMNAISKICDCAYNEHFEVVCLQKSPIYKFEWKNKHGFVLNSLFFKETCEYRAKTTGPTVFLRTLLQTVKVFLRIIFF